MVNSNHGYYTPTHTVSTSTEKNNFETCLPINSQTTSTTKTFLNNSLQAVQQKMEDLLPSSQTSASSITKELPLLSRISNEISANTANTVKVLKRRLSLNQHPQYRSKLINENEIRHKEKKRNLLQSHSFEGDGNLKHVSLSVAYSYIQLFVQKMAISNILNKDVVNARIEFLYFISEFAHQQSNLYQK